jgi:ArsR family transcriptional regulator
MPLDTTSEGNITCMVMQMTKGRKTKQPDSPVCCSGLAPHLPPRLFKALSDPKRLSLFVRLAEGREPCTVGEIAEGSNIDLSVVSRHLSILREAGLIECEKQGKEVRCCVRAKAVANLLRTLADALEACCPDESCSGTGKPATKPRTKA